MQGGSPAARGEKNEAEKSKSCGQSPPAPRGLGADHLEDAFCSNKGKVEGDLLVKTEARRYFSFRNDLACVGVDCSTKGDLPSLEASSDAQIAEHGDTSTVKILVADDEQMIANTLMLILNRSGFEARAVYSGEAAVEATNSFHPDVLISDVVMPGMTGIEAAILIRSRRPDCKILLFSGQATSADLLQDARVQGHSFEVIPKPVHPVDLLAKLRADPTH